MSGEVIKKKPQIKEISSRYVLNELAEVWGFLSIPFQLNPECWWLSVLAISTFPNLNILSLSTLVRKDLRKWMKKDLRNWKELSSVIQTL